jgi:GNAT superfamily N-acetyltransferase
VRLKQLYESTTIMNLIIRPAGPADADVICDFNRRMALETEHKELDPATLQAGVAAMLSDPAKGRYFVAEADARLVGQVGYTCEWSDWRNGNFWWVQSVYVAEAARRQGVFRRLFEHLLTAARREPNVIGVRLYVDHDNAGAQATYRQLGFVMTDYRLMEMHPLR